MEDNLKNLKNRINVLCTDRDWQKYHQPKNIAIKLAIETSEILEIFNWKTDEECVSLTDIELQNLKDELGDVLFNLINLSSKYEIDLVECCSQKILKIEQKYPIEQFKGSAKKYNEMSANKR